MKLKFQALRPLPKIEGFYQVRCVVLAALRDFCRQAKTHLTTKWSYAAEGSIIISEFFFFGSFFLFASRQKEKMNIQIIFNFSRHSYNKYYALHLMNDIFHI